MTKSTQCVDFAVVLQQIYFITFARSASVLTLLPFGNKVNVSIDTRPVYNPSLVEIEKLLNLKISSNDRKIFTTSLDYKTLQTFKILFATSGQNIT